MLGSYRQSTTFRRYTVADTVSELDHEDGATGGGMSGPAARWAINAPHFPGTVVTATAAGRSRQ